MIDHVGDGGKLLGCDVVRAAVLGSPDPDPRFWCPVARANVRWRSTPKCRLRPSIPELETDLIASMSRLSGRLRVFGLALPETSDHVGRWRSIGAFRVANRSEDSNCMSSVR